MLIPLAAAPVSRLRAAAGILLTVFWLPPAAMGDGIRANQPLEANGQQESQSPAHETLAGVTTGARITQRFEIYNPNSREQLQAVKELGFTQVILDRPRLHAEASEIGLDVVLANWWTQDTEDNQIERGLEFARAVDPRRLVAVSMMDEPERYAPDTPFSYYQALYYELRTLFDEELPAVKLEISHWGPLESWTDDRYEDFVPLYQATDRIRLMPYPDLREGPLSEVYSQMLRSRRVMRLAGRDLPQLVILQTWVLPEDPKLPTIAELRVMAYQAMLAGAETLSFYNYDPQRWRQTTGFTDGFAQLMQELKAFSQQYREARVDSQMSPHGVLTATIRPASGEPVSMLVNTNRTPVDDLAALAVVVHKRSSAVGSGGDQAGRPCRPIMRRRILHAWRPRCRHR